MELIRKFEKSSNYWFLFALSVVFVFLRFPSLFEPYWYGDEGIYETIGMALRQGKHLYSGIWDNKPPLLYTLYALVNGDQLSIKLVSIIFGVATIVSLFFLAKKLLNSNRAAYITTAVFTLFFGLPLLEGNIANAENFMLFPILLAANVVVRAEGRKKYTTLYIAGLLLSIAFLFKVVAVFDTLAFTFFILLTDFRSVDDMKKRYRLLYPYALGFFLPIFLTTLYFFLRGSGFSFLSAVFSQNVGYVGYSNKFLGIPQGLLLIKLLLLVLFVRFVYTNRKKFEHSVLFIGIWIGFSLFSVFFSQRPYTHYLLLLLPSFCLGVGLLYAGKYHKKTLALVLLAIIIVSLFHFTLYTKDVSYYTNFLSYVTGHKSTTDYRTFFDPNTVRDYDIADYLTYHIKPTDNVFIWGNSPQLYKLINKVPKTRYTAAYHITSSKTALRDVGDMLNKTHPQYIVVLPGFETFPYNVDSYTKRVVIDQATIYEKPY